MTVRLVGAVCRAWGCNRPHHLDGLCVAHWYASRVSRRADKEICE